MDRISLAHVKEVSKSFNRLKVSTQICVLPAYLSTYLQWKKLHKKWNCLHWLTGKLSFANVSSLQIIISLERSSLHALLYCRKISSFRSYIKICTYTDALCFLSSKLSDKKNADFQRMMSRFLKKKTPKT